MRICCHGGSEGRERNGSAELLPLLLKSAMHLFFLCDNGINERLICSSFSLRFLKQRFKEGIGREHGVIRAVIKGAEVGVRGAQLLQNIEFVDRGDSIKRQHVLKSSFFVLLFCSQHHFIAIGFGSMQSPCGCQFGLLGRNGEIFAQSGFMLVKRFGQLSRCLL